MYIASLLGIQVWDSAGEFLGVIPVPEQPENVAFGGKDMKTLYVTAMSSIYSCEMDVAGHRFPGKK